MVPEGWKEVPLGAAAKVIDCKHRTPVYADVGYPIVSPGNIRWGEINLELCRRIEVHELDSMMDHCEVKTGDIVMGRNQSVGIGAYVGENTEFALGQDTILIQPKEIDPRFLYDFTASEGFQRQIYRLLGGSTFARINLGDIRKLTIIAPPLPEQRKIADILSTWDAAIEKTQALLATARTQKRTLMQQLLTGKSRFPEFEGQPWQEVRLGDLGSFKKGKGLPKTEVGPTGQFPCVLYGELYTTYGEVIGTPRSRTDLDDGIISVAGDVLIPASTTTSGIDLAIAACITDDGVRLGGDINIFRRKTEEINGDFLAYFLTHACRYEMARFAQGITIVHLKGADLLDIRVCVPPVEEQGRIMNTVKDVEVQISGYQSDLSKLRTEKKALMQQLLTGKRRVTV